MNRDEVMALPDKELRVQAVELAGWKCVPCAAECATNIAAWPWMKEGIRGLPPDYPHDIAAAWELAEKLPIGTFVMRDPFDWWCEVPTHSGVRGDGLASRSITRAFVLAMTQDKP